MENHHAGAHRVDLVVYPGFKALEAIGPMSVFDYANVHLRHKGLPDGYAVRVVASQAGLVPSDTLMGLQASHTLAQVEAEGTGCTVLLVGARHIEQVLAASPELVDWVARVAPGVGRMIALCSGSFFLAAAGVLDGRRAATHWSVAGLLAQRYPHIAVDADAIYVRDGSYWTSAGVTAGIDLALAVVARDHGKKIAQDVAKVLLVVMKRQGGQAQFSPLMAAVSPQETPITRAQNYVLEHLDEPFTVERMAGLANMSARHFARLFARDVNMTPMEFLQNARIDCARNLLETSDLPLKTIAYKSGFGSVRHMRSLFAEKLGLTPLQYREQFS